MNIPDKVFKKKKLLDLNIFISKLDNDGLQILYSFTTRKITPFPVWQAQIKTKSKPFNHAKRRHIFRQY